MAAKEHSVSGSTVLVTGGCGFVGAELVRQLLARDAARVRVLDDLRCGKTEDLLEARTDPRVTLSHLALGDASREELRPLVEGADYLFHLAAEKVAHSTTNAAGMLRSNVQGTHDLLEECGRAEVKKVIFSSSVFAYGRWHEPPMRESDVPTPATVYGASKMAGEHLTRAWGKTYGREWNVVRYFFVYGPRQYVGRGYRSVIVRTAKRILAGEAPEIRGDGQQVYDYTYNDDVVAATLLALEAPVCGEVFNVSSGEAHRIKDLIERLVKVSGADLVPIHVPPDKTAGTFRVADVSKIKELLGWEPEVTLDEGLARTYAWLAEEQAKSS